MHSRSGWLLLEDIQSINSPNGVAELFQKLGYAATVQPLAIEALELSNRSASAIEEVYLIAEYQRGVQSLQILLFQLCRDEYSSYSLAKNRMKMIAGSLLKRPSHYLLVATKDYRQLLLCSPHQELDDQLNLVVNLETCHIDCTKPSFQERNWLEKLAAQQISPQSLHAIQRKVLRSAAIIQKSSDEHFTEDSTYLYLREIGRIPLLNAREEIELARKVAQFQQLRTVREELERSLEREPTDQEWAAATDIPLQSYQTGLKARNKLIAANLRLVVSIAKCYQGRGLELMDLVQEGSLGLVRAAERFDPERGCKFSTYATWWIRQGVTRAIANQSRLIRLPVHLQDKATRIKRAIKLLSQELNRYPTEAEISAHLAIDQTQLCTILYSFQTPHSLDAPLDDIPGLNLGDLFESSENLEELVNQVLIQEELRRIFSELTQRESDVLAKRYGLDNGQEMSLQEIGNVYNLSRERIRQIESKALKKLRDPEIKQHLESIISGEPLQPTLPGSRRRRLKRDRVRQMKISQVQPCSQPQSLGATYASSFEQLTLPIESLESPKSNLKPSSKSKLKSSRRKQNGTSRLHRQRSPQTRKHSKRANPAR